MKKAGIAVIIFLFCFVVQGMAYAIVDAPDSKDSSNETKKKSPLMKKIENKMGRALTDEEIQKYKDAAQVTIREIVAAQQKFVLAVSDITKIPSKDVWKMLPRKEQSIKDRDMIPKIEKKLGRKLKKDELAKIKKADSVKKKNMMEIQKNFAKKLSKITGISVNEVMQMMPSLGNS